MSATNTRYTPSQREAAVAAVRSGVAVKVAAARYGVSADSLRNWLQGRRFALFVAPDSALTRRCLRCQVKFTPSHKGFFLCPLCRADDSRCCH